MGEPVQDKIERSIQAAEGLYHRLVLLVGETGSGETGVLRDVAKRYGVEVINVNLALSAELLELTARQRALRLPGILDRVMGATQPLAVLDNLEILFDKDLKQDPLRLLYGISRNRSVVASWNGITTDGKLIYAEPGHAECRSYKSNNLLIIQSGNHE